MDRNEIKNQITGITDEQLNWIMAENGKDIAREQSVAETLRTQLKTAQDGLKAFDGVDVADLQGKITDLQNQLTSQADGFAFDNLLDGAIRAAKGKNVKAIRGMLGDLETLKSSKNRDADIKTALDNLVKSDPWAFDVAGGNNGGDTGVTVNTGGEHGDGGNAEQDGVIASFMALNPGLKI